MRQPRIVPWANAAEWTLVYNQVFSSDQAEQQRGIDRINAWRSRGRVPVAVDATSSLLQAGGSLPPVQQRLLMSMALVRFVNGLVDQAQRGAIAAAAVIVAEELGLPSWLVELRHQATHDQLPSLELLSTGRLQALHWLRVNYWDMQLHTKQRLDDAAQELLREYKRTAKRPESKAAQAEARRSKILLQLKDTFTTDTFHLIIPALFDNVTSSAKEGVVSKESLLFWESMLSTFATEWPDFATVLVESLAERISSNDPKQYLLTIWTKYILERYVLSDARVSCDRICKVLLKNPNENLVKLAKVVMASGRPLSDAVGHLVGYLEAKQKSCDSDVPDPEEAERLTRCAESRADGYKKRKVLFLIQLASMENAGWQIVPQWKSCPVGMLPGSKIPSLELFFDSNDIEPFVFGRRPEPEVAENVEPAEQVFIF